MGLLNDQVVIVTGAGSGLGRELALLFAREGAKVAICGRRMDKLNALLEEMAEYKENIVSMVADASKEADVQKFIAAIVEKFGRIDALINNAAVFESYYIADTSLESWNYQFNNNVTSAFLMTRECIPVMRKQKSGRIINMTSSLAKTGAAGFGPYSLNKAALEILTTTCDEEESSNGLIIHAFNPGVMRSGLQGTGADPATIAPYVVELLTTDNRYAGQVIDVEQLKTAQV